MSLRQTLTALLIVASFGVAIVAADDKPAESFSKLAQPFLQKHCFDCHGPTKQTAQVRYDQLKGFRAEDRHFWTAVHERLAAGEMPPPDRPQPTDAEKRIILSWIAEQQRAVRPGGTRRLNRRELSAALRDVTGLSVNYALGLPDDGKVDGFDTGAEGLQDAADSVVQIMQVTRRALDGIRFLEPAAGKVFSTDLRAAKDARQAFDSWKSDGLSANTGDTVGQPGTGLLIKPKWVGDRGGLTIKLPPPTDRLGVLRLKVVVSEKTYFEGLPHPRLWVEVGGRDIDFPEITNSADEPRTLIYEVQLADVTIDTRGFGITLCNRVELPYAVAGFENEDKSKPEDKLPGGTGLFRPQFDQKTPLDKQPVPFVVLHSIEIEPDYLAAWPPAEWKRDAGEIIDDPASVKRLLGLWIERAWRRPVSAAEQERFLALYAKARTQNLSFDEALRATFQSVLLSGSFRYLASPSDVDHAAAQHAIASRLSFMLWGAPPDRELRQLADAGKLREPAVLDMQVDRLLADPRSDAFVRPFVTQWLEMGQPITVAMDHLQKQDFRFGRHLKASMQDETVAYVGQLLAQNRPARELIASDWTMMNDILARHYGYDGIKGGHLRSVTLRPDDPRGGGILGHAGIQSMLCWMGENWVIYRGAWALRHILNIPPPPPPLEIPELNPSDGKNRGKPFRELLRQHQEDAKCALCHKNIDPLGFAFQNFDLSGRWRSVEFDHYVKNDLDGKIEWRGEGQTRPVDAVGKLPRGESFNSFAECKTLLVKNYSQDVVLGWTKNLVLYGTGRKPDVDDMTEIRAILAQQKSREYPLKDLLKAVVRSRAFLER